MAKQDFLDWMDTEIAYAMGDRKEALEDAKRKAEQHLGHSKTQYPIPTKQQVEAYFTERGEMIPKDIPLEAENFCNYYEEREWKTRDGKRIKSWKRQAATWNNNYKRIHEDRLQDYEQTNQDKRFDSEGPEDPYTRPAFNLSAN